MIQTIFIRAPQSEVEKFIRSENVTIRNFPSCEHAPDSQNLTLIEDVRGGGVINVYREKLQIHLQSRAFLPYERINVKLKNLQV